MRARFALPSREEIHRVNHSFELRARVALAALTALFLISGLAFLWQANASMLVSVPARGGLLVEGVLGTPRFVNPLLAISDADRDLSALIYSGLMRVASDGSLEPDLAERVEASDDGLRYHFTLKSNAQFHDGTPVTAEDVIFTIQRAVDPSVKSPKRAHWEGVEVAQGAHEREVVFTLKQPYAAFLENATIGILPKHLWQDFDGDSFPFSEFNTEAIGSGPYKIASIKRSSSRIPILYDLEPFEENVSGHAKINIRLRFYPNMNELLDALLNREIMSVAALPGESSVALVAQGYQVVRAPLPRTFAIFLNHNQVPAFTHREVRQALALAAPRERIVREVFAGYATSIDGPIPPGAEGYDAERSISESGNPAAARELLVSKGWKADENGILRLTPKKGASEYLAFSIATANVPELKKVAEMVAAAWREAGIAAKVEVYEEGDLKNMIIRPRKYDALLFGEVVGRSADPFSFWHSSQRLDPGLNVALYTNASADARLSEARATLNREERINKLRAFEEEVRADVGAIFLFAPVFTYLVPEELRGLELPPITNPSDRFTSVTRWYMESDRVWRIFDHYYE